MVNTPRVRVKTFYREIGLELSIDGSRDLIKILLKNTSKYSLFKALLSFSGDLQLIWYYDKIFFLVPFISVFINTGLKRS